MEQPDKQEVVIFWSYDLFPYVLGGIGTIDHMGDAHIPSYQARIQRKNIIAVYEAERGKVIIERLESIRTRYRVAQQEVLNKFVKEIHTHLPEMEDVRPIKEVK